MDLGSWMTQPFTYIVDNITNSYIFSTFLLRIGDWFTALGPIFVGFLSMIVLLLGFRIVAKFL